MLRIQEGRGTVYFEPHCVPVLILRDPSASFQFWNGQGAQAWSGSSKSKNCAGFDFDPFCVLVLVVSGMGALKDHQFYW